MRDKVRAKKSLGQHFLNDKNIAERIAQSLTSHHDYKTIVEIGPGMGVLTEFLIEQDFDLHAVEIDHESVEYLQKHYPEFQDKLMRADFLRMPAEDLPQEKFAVIGNFPYNISSQILFRVLEMKESVPEVVGMLQREVVQRICSPPGNKDYGILSVLLQTWYDTEYLFTVSEGVFSPPPKVKSAVLRLKRNDRKKLDCNEKRYVSMIKMAFNQRRKTLRNSVKSLFEKEMLQDEIFNMRPEQLSVEEFISLCKRIKD